MADKLGLPDTLVQDAFKRLAEKWSPSVLRLLTVRPRHHSDFRRILGVSAKVLTGTLRGLERDGFIVRSESPSVPVKVSYALTPMGEALVELLRDADKWGERHAAIARTG